MVEGGVMTSAMPCAGRARRAPYPACVHSVSWPPTTTAGVSFCRTKVPSGRSAQGAAWMRRRWVPRTIRSLCSCLFISLADGTSTRRPSAQAAR